MRQVDRYAHVAPTRPVLHTQVEPTALEKAKELLLSFLTTEQRESFERNGQFKVVSNKGNIFEITSQRMHNVFRLDLQGRRLEEWCVTFNGPIPLYDLMLAQKVQLEVDEDELAKHSNITLLRNGQLIRTAAIQYNPYAPAAIDLN